MTVQLTSNFLLNSRGFSLVDGGGITWSINKNTNAISANGSAAGATGANPTASVGLTAVNGSATTFLRSDGAPALSQAIIPTWSGLHTFSAGLTISGGSFTLSGHTLTLSANAAVGGTNTGDQSLPVGANPSGTVGLTAVNGSAATWMRSDGAPPLSQAIVPTWTGAHTFSGNVVTIKTANLGLSLDSNAAATSSYQSWAVNAAIKGYIGAPGATNGLITGSALGDLCIRVESGSIDFSVNGGVGLHMKLNSSGDLQVNGKFGVNGNSPAAQSTGWGTATGNAAVNNFPGGGPATLAQCSTAIAQLITTLKAVGILGT